MTKYVSTKQARELLDITTATLRNWDKDNKIKTIRNPSGARMYALADIHHILGWDIPNEKKRYIYCRVSSKKQTDDLKRQEDFLKSSYPDYTIISDVGSGINWKRPGFKTILVNTMQGNVEEVVVAHRDRLCRFAFELIEWIFNSFKTKLTVLDQKSCKSDQDELTDDIISIIHVFSCRQMGRRKYKKPRGTEEKERIETEEKTKND